MATLTQRRFVNPHLGTYFGIFTSAFAGVVLLCLIFEQLGAPDVILRWFMLLGPLALYLSIGAAAYCNEPSDYFAAGRRVPAAYSGLVMATVAVGGTGLTAGAGAFFINGYDAWCLVVGISAGFVLMALMIAPYLRKFGAFTLPSYLGRRYDSRVLRLVAAAVLIVPMLLITLAELSVAVSAGAALASTDRATVALLVVLAIWIAVLPGGIRGLTWSNSAQAIASLVALAVPVAIVAALVTNLPLPQLSHGPVLRAIGRLEQAQGVAIPIASTFAFDLAGQGLSQLINRIAAPYSSVGPVAFILASLVIMAGIAGAPWLLPRCGTTPSVYDSRKSIAWAAVFGGIILITVESIAIFMREMVMTDVAGKAVTELPQWFRDLVSSGVATAQAQGGRLALAGISFDRDSVLYALPIAAGFPPVMIYFAMAGVLAAALAATMSTITCIGHIIAEDVVEGLRWQSPPPLLRINIARLAVAAVTFLVGWLALVIPADPLDLLLIALTISASSAFPALALSIWWKRSNAFGLVVGMLTGMGVAFVLVVAGKAGIIGLSPVLAGVLGLPAAFLAATLATWSRPVPGPHVMEIVRDMRLPGGETLHDREIRLARLKDRQRV